MTRPRDPRQECVLAWDAMPEALQDTLDPNARAALERHLHACDACRAQFAFEQRLQRAMRLPSRVPLDDTRALERLLARIDRPEPAALRGALRASGWGGRALVAAVLVQAIGLGVLGAMLWSAPPAPEYRTLGREAAAPPLAGIRVVPDPSMTVADWDALLQAHRLRVVSGPNRIGGYLVAPVDDADGRDALVLALRAAPGIQLAEPAAGAR